MPEYGAAIALKYDHDTPFTLETIEEEVVALLANHHDRSVEETPDLPDGEFQILIGPVDQVFHHEVVDGELAKVYEPRWHHLFAWYRRV